MKIAFILFVCATAVVSTERMQSTAFKVSNGRLIPAIDNDSPSPADRSNSFSGFATKNNPRFSSANGRVVGGDDAEPNSAPWIVSVQWGTVRPSHVCGGSIISENWVLSSAFCASSLPNFGISTIVAGLHDLDAFTGNEQIRPVNLAEIWIHEGFTGNLGPNDISLFLTTRPFVFNAIVGPIFLPNAGEIHSGQVRLHGWGSISNTTVPVFPNILQTVVKPIIPMNVCVPLVGNNPIHENNVCTGPLEEGTSACSRDTGSPLTQDDELVGIVSWGFHPCGQPLPDVSVRVSAYISWINNIVDSKK